MEYYYKIDVSGRNGYSFMVKSSSELDEGEVIDKALEQGYFSDEYDADYAIVDDLVTPYDIDHFTECECVFEV